MVLKTWRPATRSPKRKAVRGCPLAAWSRLPRSRNQRIFPPPTQWFSMLFRASCSLFPLCGSSPAGSSQGPFTYVTRQAFRWPQGTCTSVAAASLHPWCSVENGSVELGHHIQADVVVGSAVAPAFADPHRTSSGCCAPGHPAVRSHVQACKCAIQR